MRLQKKNNNNNKNKMEKFKIAETLMNRGIIKGKDWTRFTDKDIKLISVCRDFFEEGKSFGISINESNNGLSLNTKNILQKIKNLEAKALDHNTSDVEACRCIKESIFLTKKL